PALDPLRSVGERVWLKQQPMGAPVDRQGHHLGRGPLDASLAILLTIYRAPRTQRQEDRMIEHRIGTQEEWQAARDELLEREKELTRRNDELAQQRRELPWVPIEKEYSFETEAGTKSLA